MKNTVNPMNLNERRYLITGASSGIGRAAAILLSKLGASLVLTGTNKDALSKTLELTNNREMHLISPFDLHEPLNEYKAWLNGAVNLVGKINGLAHCAGKNFSIPLKAVSDSLIQEAFELNVFSTIKLVSIFRKKKISTAENKSIVLLSSVMGKVGKPGTSIYAATKGSLLSLSRSLALELVSENIRVNCISPACVETEMTKKLMMKLSDEQMAEVKKEHPMGFGQPEDVANMIAFLFAGTSQWITGSNFFVDGGYTAK